MPPPHPTGIIIYFLLQAELGHYISISAFCHLLHLLPFFHLLFPSFHLVFVLAGNDAVFTLPTLNYLISRFLREWRSCSSSLRVLSLLVTLFLGGKYMLNVFRISCLFEEFLIRVITWSNKSRFLVSLLVNAN